ncbi:hypothetical protein [Alistipes indistinctus]|uniref:hypothetical protein n=1 Tax=Alistipes indistinctus TaxID=626932 RepID=UPI00206837E0|nr:MAG TPA: hypothetical protein [Caudoviricetes sp.]
MKVGNYEFALKGIKHFPAGSEETECFVAVLYVNGKKLADCSNEGHGGSTNVRFYPETVRLGREIEAFLATQPKIRPEGYDFELDLDLEYIADDLLYKHLHAKEREKLMRKADKSLVFQDKNKGYYHISWKNKQLTIATLLKMSTGRASIKSIIAAETAKGSILLNENIPAELLPQAK